MSEELLLHPCTLSLDRVLVAVMQRDEASFLAWYCLELQRAADTVEMAVDGFCEVVSNPVVVNVEGV